MAVRTEPKYGFQYGWVAGDDDWGDPMNKNMELMMILMNPSVISDQVATPPGTPAIGDIYIPAAGATGAWAGHTGKFAVWWQTPAQSSPAWLIIVPKAGLVAWIQSGTARLIAYNGTAWVNV